MIADKTLPLTARQRAEEEEDGDELVPLENILHTYLYLLPIRNSLRVVLLAAHRSYLPTNRCWMSGSNLQLRIQQHKKYRSGKEIELYESIWINYTLPYYGGCNISTAS